MPSIHLNRHQRTTLEGIFHHPTSNNLEWHDVEAFLRHVGSFDEKADGRIDASVGCDHAVIPRSRGKDVDPDAIRALQTLLRKAGFGPS